MADISTELVKEYFEANNFLVRSIRKFAATPGQKPGIEEIDLIVINLKPSAAKPKVFVLSTEGLCCINQAVIKVKGWHTETFVPSVLAASPQIFNFVKSEVLQSAEALLGTASFKKILVVPSMPVTPEAHERSVDVLKEKGVDNVLEFRTILYHIVMTVKPNKNYVESDILQTIRLLKNYDLLKDVQMELFSKKAKH